jgi:hypothetical protein
MKRLALLVGFLAPAGLGAQTIPVRLGGGLSSFTAVPFDVPIEVDWSARADRLGSFTMVLRWDPAVLRVDAAGPGAFSAVTINADSVLQGVLKLAGANPNGAAGRVTVGVARFTPLQTTSTTILLDVRELAAAGPAFTNALTDAAPENGLYCPARGYWGDADGDRSSGSRDALLALSAAVGLDVSAFPDIGLADVDASVAIEARDALIILSHAVGIDVSTFRVMRIALGPCGSDAVVTYAVAPDTATVAVNQGFVLQLRATVAGASRGIPDVFWRSSDPSVLFVQQDGHALALAPGTATLIGKSGPRDSAVATLTVLARRSGHVVDAAAIVNAIRLGNSEYPFASAQEASFAAQDGDTVFMRPGRYLEDAVFIRSVTVLGAAPGVRILGSGLSSTALSFYGAGASQVANLAFDSSDAGIWAQQPFTGPPSSLRVVNVTMRDVDYPIQTENVLTTVQGADFARGSSGVSTFGGGVDSVTASTFADFDYALDLEDAAAYVVGNIIQGPRSVGIFSYGAAGEASTILTNDIACDSAAFALGIDAETADHRIEGNTLSGCDSGIYATVAAFGSTPRLELRGNTVDMPANVSGTGILVSGAFNTQVVKNVVRGGSQNGPGSIKVAGDFYSGRPPAVRLDSNQVQNAVVWAIYVGEVDTLIARGNLVEDVAGSSIYFFSGHGGFTVGNVYGTLRLVGNTLRRIHTRTALGVLNPGGAVAVLDSNAVSGADSAAIQIDGGALVMTGNNIQNNGRYGLYIPFATGVDHQAHGNAFKGNALFAIHTPSDSVDASSNWWGMDGQAPGAGGADAVSGRTGDVTPLLAAPVVPALTPRVLLEASAQAAAATLVPRSGTRLTPEQRRAAGRAGVERFAAGRAERYRWYESELARKGRAAP